MLGMILKYFCQRIWRKNWHFFAQTAASFFPKKLIISFSEKRRFFRRKAAKIAEN
jgi:hypothetical protein